MADGEVIAYSIASFICALFVLEFGADKFIDNTAVVARRTGIPQTVIALLTAGAEWEELAVVVISIARHRSSLAVGNIIGSAISNVLGAFSLGLLFHSKSDEIVFDKSSKLYSVLLLVLSGLIAGLLGFGHHIMWRVVGGCIIGLFAVYVGSIAWAIGKGRIAAPELSDSDGSDDSDVDEPHRDHAGRNGIVARAQQANGVLEGVREHGDSGALGTTQEQSLCTRETEPTNRTLAQRRPGGSLRSHASETHSTDISAPNTTSHGLTYHVALLFAGFIALILSAYVLSNAASTLVAQFGISDVLFGVVILSIATTIPEKFIAVVSGSRGHTGIMVANTVGSNVFLLTLCMGILWTTTDGELNEGSVNPAEIGVMLGSTVWMTLTIWLGAKWARYIGAAMLAAYIAFIVLEFAIIRQV